VAHLAWEKRFLTLDNGLLRENAYKDIGSLLDWVAKQPDLDASWVMVTGASYGGNAALVTAMKYPDRIRCAIDWQQRHHELHVVERHQDYNVWFCWDIKAERLALRLCGLDNGAISRA